MADKSTYEPHGMTPLPAGDGLSSSYAKGARSRKSTGTTKFIVTVGGAFAVIVGAVLWSVNNEINNTRLARPSAIDSTPGGRIQEESDLYQERLARYNENRADAAEQRGITFVPTPDMILRPLGEDDLLYRPEMDEEAPVERSYEIFNVDNRVEWSAKRPVEFGPPPSAHQLYQIVMNNDGAVGRSAFGSGGQASGSNKNASGQEEEENPFTAAITRQMGSATDSFAPGESAVFGDGDPQETSGTEGSGKTGGLPDGVTSESDAASAAAEEPEMTLETIMGPGDILYGETLNYVTSDLATPVLVKLTTGPHAGARLTGSFQVDQASSKLFIAFSTITFEDGETVPIQAFAVDGFTSASTVASSVNKRYMARYGAVMASAFVAGFADSAATAGESVVASGNNTIVTGVAPTTEQSLYAGIAEAGSVIASDIASRAPKGPEIIIRAGYPVGVLVVGPVSIEAETEAQGN